jgi:hypothetical protein
LICCAHIERPFDGSSTIGLRVCPRGSLPPPTPFSHTQFWGLLSAGKAAKRVTGCGILYEYIVLG